MSLQIFRDHHPASRHQFSKVTVRWLLASFLAVSAIAASAFEVTPTPEPPPQYLIDALDASVEENTGEGVSSVSNGNPTTWLGEDASVLAFGEEVRYRLYSYQFSEDVPSCGAYAVSVSMAVTANGPDIGINDNIFFSLFDGVGASAVQTYFSPASIGASSLLELSVETSAAGLAGGVIIFYGATTFQNPDISSGYTFGAPAVEVLTDFSACATSSESIPALSSLQLGLLSFALGLIVVVRRRGKAA